METKFSVSVDGVRKSVSTNRLSVSANRSHLVIDVHGDQGDLVSLRLDRDSFIQIIRNTHSAGMFEPAVKQPVARQAPRSQPSGPPVDHRGRTQKAS